MKDILIDIVSHTHSLGFLPNIKITGSTNETIIESMAEDRSVVLTGKTNKVIPEFLGIFGMSNLEKLNFLLKCPEYKENAKIEIIIQERNGIKLPTTIHFENNSGDFTNDYRLMNTEIINEKLKSVRLQNFKWEISLVPSLSSIQKLKFQSQANSEEDFFEVVTKNNNLYFNFGTNGTHSGNFIFEANVKAKLKNSWLWPITKVIQILNLPGDKILKISDNGALMIAVNSGLVEYNYILPAKS
jgi:hypothetical protein